MTQQNVLKNISGTACVIGLALTSLSINSTMVIDGNYTIPTVPTAIYSYNDTPHLSSIMSDVSNIYENREDSKPSRLEMESQALFGTMRDASAEEMKSVNNYIKSISRNTGVNFFDIC